MGLFSNSKEARQLEETRRSGWDGPADRDGRAVMSRTDSKGKSLPLFEGGTGWGPKGEPDSNRGKSVWD